MVFEAARTAAINQAWLPEQPKSNTGDVEEGKISSLACWRGEEGTMEHGLTERSRPCCLATRSYNLRSRHPGHHRLLLRYNCWGRVRPIANGPDQRRDGPRRGRDVEAESVCRDERRLNRGVTATMRKVNSVC